MTNEKETRPTDGRIGSDAFPAEPSHAPGAMGAVTSNAPYAAGPPPAYTEMPPPTYALGGAAVGAGVAPTNPPGGSAPSGSIAAPFPAARYDTMTSYVEDGSAVQTVITTGVILDQPILVRCPFCKATVTSETRPVSGSLTWLCCIALSAVGCIYGCCLLPFCSRRLRDVEHHCPKCKNLIALYKRL